MKTPESSTGLVIIKKVGVVGIKHENNKVTTEQKVEILTPERFEGAGIFETVLTPDIEPSDIKAEVDQRFVAFIQDLHI